MLCKITQERCHKKPVVGMLNIPVPHASEYSTYRIRSSASSSRGPDRLARTSSTVVNGWQGQRAGVQQNSQWCNEAWGWLPLAHWVVSRSRKRQLQGTADCSTMRSKMPDAGDAMARYRWSTSRSLVSAFKLIIARTLFCTRQAQPRGHGRGTRGWALPRGRGFAR